MFKKIIKIPGKGFLDLSLDEVASMIEADSSLQPEGDEQFDSCALDEFLHCVELAGRDDLEFIRNEILKNIYIDIPGKKNKDINTSYLRQLAANIRERGLNVL